jgi:uncharacterized protein (TIGR03032 family)
MEKQALPTAAQKQLINFNYPDSLVEWLLSAQATIVMSTYQSGKIMLIGQYAGELDIRYKNFPRPMGMYAKGNNLWAGLGNGIWQFRNAPNAAAQVDEKKSYSACYLPGSIHFTANIDIHEMEFGAELYFINTKFSCLCVKGEGVNFKPIWKPSFISSLQPTDKCHLNGLCLRDGEPRYVTALGQTDEPLGWRANKANGGVLIDITTDEVLLEGLSMPHSPRWHQGSLWFLESGRGTLSRMDPVTREVSEVAQVPGFTRGMQLVGDVALIGISKVRESATFSGLPVTKLPKRICGIWVVNIKTGKTLTWIEFTGGIDEIFAVNLLPHAVTEIVDFDHPLVASNYVVDDNNLAEIKMPETSIEHAAPLFEKGADLYNENRKEEALVEYAKALKVQPDYLPATFNMAIALGDLGRFDEAEQVLLDVVERDASIVETYNSLGYVYYKKGAFEKSQQNFEKAIELKPDYLQAQRSLEILLSEMCTVQSEIK